MKLLWTLSIAWSLYCTASALQCYTCTNPADLSCTSTALQTCTQTNPRCITASLASLSTQSTGGWTHKGCVSDSVCLTTGTVTTTANLGRGTGIVTSHCCNSDGCNNPPTTSGPTFSSQTLNGRQCFTCDEQTSTICNLTLSCVGDQDSCVNGTVSSGRKTFGCASSNFCGLEARLSVFSPLADLANFTEGPKCCSKDCCNSASALKSIGVAVPLVLWVVAVTLSS